MAVFLVYVAAVFGLFAVLAAVEKWLTGRENGRCDACGFEQLTPRDDPPAGCPRCRRTPVFWVREGEEDGR